MKLYLYVLYCMFNDFYSNPLYSGDRAHLDFMVSLEDYGIPYSFIDWCDTNCKYKWGWHFKNEKTLKQCEGKTVDYQKHQSAFMSFENNEEAILFKLTHVGK